MGIERKGNGMDRHYCPVCGEVMLSAEVARGLCILCDPTTLPTTQALPPIGGSAYGYTPRDNVEATLMAALWLAAL